MLMGELTCIFKSQYVNSQLIIKNDKIMPNKLFYLLYAIYPIFALHAPNLLAGVLGLMALSSIFLGINYQDIKNNQLVYSWLPLFVLGGFSLFYAYDQKIFY